GPPRALAVLPFTTPSDWVSCHRKFFFFQAEDGIRDGHVTGVQTCALPICSLASGRSLRYTSHVSSVEQELNADASELISAASIPASTRPLNPAGRSRVTSAGYAASADPPRMSEYNAAAMIPGSTNMNTGRIFRNPAKM